jgi:hypothetical protein
VAPGDGWVTAESATGLPADPWLQTLRVCARHTRYLEDPVVLARVVDFLLH